MSASNSRYYTIEPSRWAHVHRQAIAEVPVFTCYLAGERIGAARMALTHLDANPVRVLYLGRVETAWGELSFLAELPPQSDEATAALRDSESALKALDCVSYAWENGASATFDAVTGFWTVWLREEVIATGLDRASAIDVGHRQVAA